MNSTSSKVEQFVLVSEQLNLLNTNVRRINTESNCVSRVVSCPFFIQFFCGTFKLPRFNKRNPNFRLAVEGTGLLAAART